MAVPHIPLFRRVKSNSKGLSQETAELLQTQPPLFAHLKVPRRRSRLAPVVFAAFSGVALGGLLMFGSSQSTKGLATDSQSKMAQIPTKPLAETIGGVVVTGEVPKPVAVTKTPEPKLVEIVTPVYPASPASVSLPPAPLPPATGSDVASATPIVVPVVLDAAPPLTAWPVIGEVQPKRPVGIAEAKIEAPKPIEVAPPAPAVAPSAPVETAALAAPATIAAPITAATVPDTTCVADLQTKAKKLRVLFASGSSKIAASDKKLIAAFAAAAAKCPAAKVEVAGHTDSAGDTTNTDLSLKRAQEVTRILGESGLDAARLKSAGYGTRELVVKVKAPKIAKPRGDFSAMQFGPVGDTGGVTPEQARRIVSERGAPNRRVEFRVKQ